MNHVNWNDIFYIKDDELYWKSPISTKIKPGNKAWHKTKSRYISVMYNNKNYLCHRVIWIMVNGYLDDGLEIDHINHVRCDNRIENLRTVNRTQNVRNLSKNKMNTSGVMGVSYEKQRDKWSAYIWDKNKKVYIGRFDKRGDAIDARKAKEVELGYHINHGAES